MNGGINNLNKAFNEMLDKPDTTLEKILEQSEIIQELKGGNKKLIDL